MSRIRSIHPGFFTDEDLVQVSRDARLLFIGLGVEADDKGCFEWKPLTLKMRLFPADNIDIDILLAELASVNAVTSYDIEGRQFGAIRNFRKFQRPKSPNDIHPMPDELRNFVGLTPAISEPFPQKGEKSPQMEDGGKEEEKKETPSGDVPVRPEGISSDIPPTTLEAKTYALGKQVLGKSSGGVITKLRRLCRGDLTEVTRLLQQAGEKADPMEWVSAVLRGDANAEAERREAEIYAGLQ